MTFEAGRKRVAIVGFCGNSREWTPYEDPTIECWGLNRGYIFMRRAERWFDMHGPAIVHSPFRRPGNHLEWLKHFPGPVVMHKADPEIPNSVTYPLDDVAAMLGANIYRTSSGGELTDTTDEPYLTSSIAQEIALAIHEGYDEIRLYGIDLNTDSEYAWQKPGVEFLIGFAAARGIKVVLPDNCPLLRGNIYGRGYLSPEGEQMSLEQLETRRKSLEHEHQQVSQQLHELMGAEHELEFIQAQMVPGLDHEQLDKRRQKMQQMVAQLKARAIELQGGLRETAYWIHQTPNGQDPAEAVEQFRARANGHVELPGESAEGPLTELAAMQYPEPAEAPVLMPAIPGG